MPRIAQLTNAAVYIYADDHAPPHFHLRGPNSSAIIEIGTLQVLRGKYQHADFAEAASWATANMQLLVQKWHELNERE